MMERQNGKKEVDDIINQSSTDIEVEVTYFIIDYDSISTHYVDKDTIMNEPCKINEQTKNSDDVAQALKDMELIENASNDKLKDKMNIEQINTVRTTEMNNVPNQKILPTSSRWLKTFNIAQEILKPGKTDRPTHTNIAIQFPENHTKETYVDLLRKIAKSNNIPLQLKETDNSIQVKSGKEIFEVPIDNFHSYLRQENGILCIVCHFLFPEQDENIHKYEVRHMNNVLKILDYRGFRKVNYSYSHCIICNLRVKNKKEAAAHIKKESHINTRSLLLKTEGSSKKKVQSTRI